MDEPIILSTCLTHGMRLDMYVLGDLRFANEDEEEEQEEDEGEEPMEYIYVIECSSGKYYVGRTSNPSKRLEDHVCGFGSAWTRKYQPIRIVEMMHAESRFEEDKMTLEYMHTHGVENVRGGSYVQIKLSKECLASIERQMRTAEDRCSKCGKEDHFVASCPKGAGKKRTHQEPEPKSSVFCVRCGRQSHLADRCHARADINGDALNGQHCFRCGRESHNAKKCYARSDVWGNPLN